MATIKARLTWWAASRSDDSAATFCCSSWITSVAWPREDSVAVYQFLDAKECGGAVDLVPEHFRDALPVSTCLVAGGRKRIADQWSGPVIKP